ncbi:cysteine hydrolase family protein [Ancylobacter terrae]|uniref:cysteine hydrolase family protein n=1 Tax=Ancylobacter sp. sgz301288 TaxID=3342077 RepID=UPI003859E61D
MPRRALVLIDLQNDYFPDGKWPLVDIEAAGARAARILAAARAAGDLVVHVRHEQTGPDAPFFVAGSAGAQTHPMVRAEPGEAVIVKNEVNAFKATGLKDVLDGADITRITLVGAMSHMCVDAAARAASDLGYTVTVVHDACATHDLEHAGTKVPADQVHAAFMAALGFAYAELVSADEYLAASTAAD